MYLRTLSTAIFLLAPAICSATLITLDPDSHRAGTNISDISPYVSITARGGAPVFSSTVDARKKKYFRNAGAMGKRVFSKVQDYNSEWMDLTDYHEPEFLDWITFSFSQSVTSVSLLYGELFGDAGTGSEPMDYFVYDLAGNLIGSSDYKNRGEVVSEKGPRECLTVWKSRQDEFGNCTFWTSEITFTHENIGRIIIGGDSEPTTFDRLSFNTKDNVVIDPPLAVPQPPSYALLLVAFLSTAYLTRRQRGFNKTS